MKSATIINKIIGLFGAALIFVFYLGFVGIVFSTNTYSVEPPPLPPKTNDDKKCPETSIISCDESSPIVGLLNQIVNIMTILVGIVAVGGVVFGAFLYTTSAGNPEQTKKALNQFRNVLIGLVAYGAFFVLLNWIIPGGLFE